MDELDNKSSQVEQVDDDSFASILKAELVAMHERRVTEQERVDPIYLTLSGVIERMEGNDFYAIYNDLSDPEKYAIITRFENRLTTERNMPPESRTIPKEVNKFIQNERKQLGITTTIVRKGKVTEITDINRISELRSALNNIFEVGTSNSTS